MWEDQGRCIGSLGKFEWVEMSGRGVWSISLEGEVATKAILGSSEVPVVMWAEFAFSPVIMQAEIFTVLWPLRFWRGSLDVCLFGDLGMLELLVSLKLSLMMIIFYKGK